MSNKRYVNRAKSGALALPAKVRRRPVRRGASTSKPTGANRHRGPTPQAPSPAPSGERWFDDALEALAERGWFTCPAFLRAELADALSVEARSLWVGGAFRPAGMGRGEDWHVDPDVRGDWLHWLDLANPSPPQREFFALMDAFRARINREFLLSLRELELQYAVYPPGTRYRRHIDQFRQVQARLITVLLYLNPDWGPEHGGALSIYPDPDAKAPTAEVIPFHNTFVCFRSERIPHEVLAPTRHRYSLGGWFRVRPA